MKITKKYIEETLLTKNKTLNSNKIKNVKETNEELYLIYNDIEKPICICGKPKKFNSFKKGYFLTCGDKKCINNHPERIRKIQEKLPDDIGKRRSDGLKKRTEEEIQKSTLKSKQTRLQKYNDENYVGSEKAKQTNMKKYGVISYFKTKEFSKKAKQSKLLKYDDENYNNSKKRKATREKNKLDGVQYTINPIKNLDKLTKKYIEDNFIKDGFLDKFEFMIFFNCKETFMYKKLKELCINYKRTKSYSENEINKIFDYIFEHNNREIIKPLEIDLFSEVFKFGIEYNGLLSHSSGNHKYYIFDTKEEKQHYHINKTNLMEEKGYTLYHIFENEWLDESKKSIWVSIINDKLNKNNKIGARKCIIKEVPTKEARIFIDDNHIQGYNNSSIKIGLYYNNELMSIMTFGKSRYDKNIEYELIRFCTKKGYTIQGGGTRLLKYFERKYKPKSLISYANRRWSQGNFYEKVGFIFSHNTVPNFFYFKIDEKVLWSRNKFQKHKLKDIFENFNPNLTGTENMYNNGYRKIYDSGNKVYIKHYK